jgi:uncharacterized protein
MTMGMHAASVPVFVRMLKNLSSWLDKAEAHAQARKFDPAVLLGMRLAPDMLPLTSQVQIACDAAKFFAARIGGVEAPKFADDETTLAQLRERVQKTIDYLRSVPAERIDGTEAKDVQIPRREGPLPTTGENYLRHFALPNFFFHVTTTYALLRHAGVELGKADYLSGGDAVR